MNGGEKMNQNSNFCDTSYSADQECMNCAENDMSDFGCIDENTDHPECTDEYGSVMSI